MGAVLFSASAVYAVSTFIVQQGGTGVNTFPSSQLIYGNGTNPLSSVATSTLTATSPLTGSFVQIGSSGALGCQTASGSQAGCLSSADWNTFNNKTAFGETWKILNGALTPTTTLGIIVNASSTIGGGGLGTGLSIAGGATTTNNLLVGTATLVAPSTPAQLEVNAQAGRMPFYVGSSTSLFEVDGTTGFTSVGSTSPFARFSIHANPNQQMATTLFAIASSTSGATTTLLTVSNTGKATFAGQVVLPAGSAAAPSIVFVNTTGTQGGFYGAGASSIGLGFAGINTQTFWSDGSIYLGGTVPEFKLPSGGWQDWNADTYLSRQAAGILRVGTTNANALGTIIANTVGVGSTTPFGKLSIHANNGDTNVSLFNIGSSTQTATTTLFNISNIGNVSVLGNILPTTDNGTNIGSSANRLNSIHVATEVRMGASGLFDFNSDTSFSRLSAGVFGVGTGAAGSVAGGLIAASSTFNGDLTTSGIFKDTQTATSTFSGPVRSTCFTTDGTTCLTAGGGSGTVTSVATDATLTGGTITTTGTLGLNLANANTWTALQTHNAPITISSTLGSLQFDNLLTGYASSTNNTTIWGQQAGGQNATTSATDRGLSAFGFKALNALTTGASNSAFGYQALGSTTVNKQDSAFGYQAGRALDNGQSTSDNDTFVGYRAGYGNNVRYGAQGITAVGASAGLNLQTGSDYNTLFGFGAGNNITTGANNVILGGYSTLSNSNITSGSNNIVIGYNILTPSAVANNTFNLANILFGINASATGGGVVPVNGQFGVGTSTPFATFGVHALNGATHTVIFAVASSTQTATTTLWQIDNVGHQYASTTRPTLSSCGTTPTILGDDNGGEVTVGSVAATGCTITFGQPWLTAPFCTVTNQSLGVVNAFTYTISATAITVSQTGLTSAKVDYVCHGSI